MQESLFSDCRKCSGIVGVPITYLSAHCTEQFSVLGTSQGDTFIEAGGHGVSKQFVDDYYKAGKTGMVREGWKHIVMYKDGEPIAPYFRLLIQRKTKEI